MRTTLIVILSLVLVLSFVPAEAKEVFRKGVNLSGWFQENSVRAIQFNQYTQKDLQEIKSLGCDVIRLPINLHAMTNGAPDYQIDPLFFRFLDEVVAGCEELGLALILDNHTFDPFTDTTAAIETPLLKVWAQMAEHYKDWGDFLYYEILNEPHGLDPAVWGKIQLNVLQKIRQIDKKHTIIVGGANWNDIDSLYLLPEYQDENIIYTFHFYDPFVFTHQGAEWATPSLKPLKGIPYPYNPEEMPACPKELAHTWIAGNLKYDYPKHGNNEALEKQLLKTVEFRNKRGKPVFCGEFGVYNRNSRDEDRVYWYESVRNILEKYAIPWTSWDYRGGFGLFKKDSDEFFGSDLNLPLLKVLGFNEVSQKEVTIIPETSGFHLFDQYPAPGIFISTHVTRGKIDLYDDTVLDDNLFAIKMADLDRYNLLHFGFKPRKDLSLLLKQQYNLVLKVKVKPGFQNMDIRFLAVRADDPLALPWRMRYTLDAKALKKTTDWQTVTVPLEKFREHGAWKEKWYTPRGLFDWRQIVALELVAENGKWPNTGIYIAELKLAGDGVNEGPSLSNRN